MVGGEEKVFNIIYLSAVNFVTSIQRVNIHVLCDIYMTLTNFKMSFFKVPQNPEFFLLFL